MQLRFTVTEADIRNGKHFNSYYCPITLAVSRTLKTKFVFTNLGGIFISDTDFPHSPESLEFLRRFDAGETVEPATFVLNERVETGWQQPKP